MFYCSRSGFIQKQPLEVFYKNKFSKKFCKMHRKIPVQESLFNELVGQRHYTSACLLFCVIAFTKNTFEWFFCSHCCNIGSTLHVTGSLHWCIEVSVKHRWSMIKFFAKIVNSWELLTISAKSFIIYNWQWVLNTPLVLWKLFFNGLLIADWK